MKQLNMVLPENQEDNLPKNQEDGKSAVGTASVKIQKSELLGLVHQNFGFYGGISLIFGLSLAVFFYKAWLGLNIFAFSVVIIILLSSIMNKLNIKLRTETKIYYTGVFLLGFSTCLTSSGILQFLNIIGMLFLLDLSLLHQFYDDRQWNFAKHTGRMFGMVFFSIASLGMPFVDGIDFLKHTKFLKNDVIRNVLLGLVFSVPVLFVTAALLSNADMVFGKLTSDMFHSIFSADIFFIINIVLFGFLACYCILCGVLYKVGQEEKNIEVKADTAIAVTFMTVLCLMYAVFCGIQLVYLFANGLFTLPSGLTFAQYARTGFFELLAVTFINIIIMLICNTIFKESKLLRFLITCMTACTYIMIASAAYRMLLYIGAYHLTFLRIFVLLTLFIDALILAGIIILQYKKSFPLFRYCVAVISICYIAFSFSKPDYYIAAYLAGQNDKLTIEDMDYLTVDLSLDAAPIVIPLLNNSDRWTETHGITYKSGSLQNMTSYKNDRNQYYNRISDAKTNMGIRDFNFSYYNASRNAMKYKGKE